MKFSPFEASQAAAPYANPFFRWSNWKFRCGLFAVLFGVYLSYCCFQLAKDSSFENNPFAGALILVITANDPGTLILGIVTTIVLVAGISSFFLRPHAGTFLITLLCLCIWLAISILQAMSSVV